MRDESVIERIRWGCIDFAFVLVQIKTFMSIWPWKIIILFLVYIPPSKPDVAQAGKAFHSM